MLTRVETGDEAAFAAVAALFSDFPFHRGHFGSVLLGAAPGRVFTDSGLRPRAAMILPDDGFAYLACPGAPEDMIAELALLVAELAARGCLELVVAGKVLEDRIPDIFGDVEQFEVPRLSFLPPSRAALPGDAGLPAVPAPPGMEYEVASGATRLDVVLREEGREVGRCGGWIYEGEVETDIQVAEDRRRQGLGTGLGRAYLEACLSRGLSPRWTCWADKTESVRLARRLGFRDAGSFCVHIHDGNEPDGPSSGP